MPHQCLNCGVIIPRGSQDILNGCSGCGGKKFMYVSAPMDEKRRLEIKNQADRVRNQLLSKADKEILEALERKGIGEIGGVKLTLEGSRDDGWFRVTPPSADERRSEVVPSPDKAGASQKKTARDLIKDYDREMAATGRVQPGSITRKPPETDERPEPITFTEGIRTRKRKKAPGKKSARPARATPHSDDINVIKIVEKGVYEIDVQKLLDDSPIIIERDGTYLIHLPSLLESRRFGKK